MTNEEKTAPNPKSRIRILRLLQEKERKSRVDLADRMGLTKAAVTIITNDMIRTGVLYEDGTECMTQTFGRGRRKVALSINQNFKFAFGVTIEKDYVKFGLSNIGGELLDKSSKSIKDKSYLELLEIIHKEINDLIKNNCIEQDKILAIGVTLSGGAGSIINGDTPAEKLSHVKKDLAHALSQKITTQTTASAALIAEKLFGGKGETFLENALLIRYGSSVESSFFANGQLYRPLAENSGGFDVFQQEGDKNSFENFESKLSIDVDVKNKMTAELNDKLAKDLSICQTVLSPDTIYAFGTFFDSAKRIKDLNDALSKIGNIVVKPSIIQENNIFLAGCAIVIDENFYQIGGY